MRGNVPCDDGPFYHCTWTQSRWQCDSTSLTSKMGSRIGPGVLLGCRVEQTALSALPVPSSKSLLFRHLGVPGCIFPVDAEAGIRP